MSVTISLLSVTADRKPICEVEIALVQSSLWCFGLVGLLLSSQLQLKINLFPNRLSDQSPVY